MDAAQIENGCGSKTRGTDNFLSIAQEPASKKHFTNFCDCFVCFIALELNCYTGCYYYSTD